MHGNQPSNRGLTPVVGIVLLIAITLLLAATVAAFAFGIEDQQAQSRAPTAALGFEYDYAASGDDTLTIVHKSGQSVDAAKLKIDVEGATCTGTDPNGQHDATTWIGGEFSSGKTIAIDGASLGCSNPDLDLRSATVRVIWTSNTGTSSMLQSWTGPG